jgi:hypothetical protein
MIKIYLPFLLLLLCLQDVSAQGNSNIIIKAVGDVMPGSATSGRVPADSGKAFISALQSSLSNSDITIGNLECAVVTDDMRPMKCSEQSRKSKVCFEFGTPVYMLDALKRLGFTHFSLDNNHSDDFGREGYALAVRSLLDRDMWFAGKRQPVVNMIKNKRIAFASFAFYNESYKISDLRTTDSVIKRLKSFSDIVIVYFHGGAEGRKAMQVEDKREIFLGEDRGNVVAFAHTAISAGADLVIGSGPHVLRAMELYKGKLIAYSLGNFLTYGGFNLSGENGIGAILNIELSPDNGNFVAGKIVSTAQKSPGIPRIDDHGRGADLLKKLTMDYSPESFEFGSDGEFKPKK